MIRPRLYRPFFKQAVAFDDTRNNDTDRLPGLYSTVTVTMQGSALGCLSPDAVPLLLGATPPPHTRSADVVGFGRPDPWTPIRQ